MKFFSMFVLVVGLSLCLWLAVGWSFVKTSGSEGMGTRRKHVSLTSKSCPTAVSSFCQCINGCSLFLLQAIWAQFLKGEAFSKYGLEELAERSLQVFVSMISRTKSGNSLSNVIHVEGLVGPSLAANVPLPQRATLSHLLIVQRRSEYMEFWKLVWKYI